MCAMVKRRNNHFLQQSVTCIKSQQLSNDKSSPALHFTLIYVAIQKTNLSQFRLIPPLQLYLALKMLSQRLSIAWEEGGPSLLSHCISESVFGSLKMNTRYKKPKLVQLSARFQTVAQNEQPTNLLSLRYQGWSTLDVVSRESTIRLVIRTQICMTEQYDSLMGFCTRSVDQAWTARIITRLMKAIISSSEPVFRCGSFQWQTAGSHSPSTVHSWRTAKIST